MDSYVFVPIMSVTVLISLFVMWIIVKNLKKILANDEDNTEENKDVDSTPP